MKKLALLLILSVAQPKLWSQETLTKQNIQKNIVKTDVTELLLTGTYHLNASWEHLLSRKSSLQLDFAFENYANAVIFNDYYMMLGVSYRYYLNKNDNQLKGLYLSPFIRGNWRYNNKYRYNYCYGTVNNHTYNETYLTAGLQVGYQWIIHKKWTLDLNLGAEINPFLKSDYYTPFDNIKYSLGLKFGYKF